MSSKVINSVREHNIAEGKAKVKSSPTPKSTSKSESNLTDTTTIRWKNLSPQERAHKALGYINSTDVNLKMYGAYRFYENKYWEHLGSESLKQVIQNKIVGMTYQTFLRYAHAAKAYHTVMGGNQKPKGCSEASLRPLTSLDEPELAQVREYLSKKAKSLNSMSKAVVEKSILQALAPNLKVNNEGINGMLDGFTKTIVDNLGDANLTSNTAINMLSDHIGKRASIKVRKALKAKIKKNSARS